MKLEKSPLGSHDKIICSGKNHPLRLKLLRKMYGVLNISLHNVIISYRKDRDFTVEKSVRQHLHQVVRVNLAGKGARASCQGALGSTLRPSVRVPQNV